MNNRSIHKTIVTVAMTMVVLCGFSLQANTDTLLSKPMMDEATEKQPTRYYVKYHLDSEPQTLIYLSEHNISVVDHMRERRVILVSSEDNLIEDLSDKSFVDYVEEEPQRERYSQ